MTIFICGNATADAELGNHAGKDVANVTIAVNNRIKEGDQWVDGPATFYRIAVWQTGPNDKQPQNVAQSVRKGLQVIVKGTLTPREYEHNGQTRTSLDVKAEDIGIGLRFKPTGGPAPTTQHATDAWGHGGSGHAEDVPPF